MNGPLAADRAGDRPDLHRLELAPSTFTSSPADRRVEDARANWPNGPVVAIWPCPPGVRGRGGSRVPRGASGKPRLSGAHHRGGMDDLRFGAVIRRTRQRRGWRQADLASKAGVSPTTVGRVERGHVRTLTLENLRSIAGALEVRVELTPRWRGGDLDRLLNANHSRLHEAVAQMFVAELPDWVLAPEVSFSVFGERGVIDILAWHPGRRALLLIDLKTGIADVNEMVGTFDRKRRLARTIARERGWDPLTIGAWVIVATTRTNR